MHMLLYIHTYFKQGERSQVVKALGCGSSIRGFDSRRSPLFILSQEKRLNI
jgi:hypothetical protein